MKNYQFEVLDEEINKNKAEAILRDRKEEYTAKKEQKKYKLRRWVKVTLWTLFVAYISIALYQVITIKTYHTTPVGTYTCQGKLIKVCSGSEEVADYLGV